MRAIQGPLGGVVCADELREADFCALDLASFGVALEPPGDLDQLGDAGGAERMALGEQAAARIDRHAAAEGGVAAARIADRAYDTNAIRDLAAERGAWANIPPRSIRKGRFAFSGRVYRKRNLVK